MAEKTVNLNIKAVDRASAEMAKIEADVRKLERAVVSYGTATGPAKAASAQFYDTLRASKGITDGASGGLRGLDGAAKDLAKGGLRDLLSEIPLVGGALSKLAGTLGGFPLLLGGIVGAGLGVLKFLQNWNAETTKALASTTALASKIGTDFRDALLEVQRIRADAAGDKGGALEAAFQRDLERIEATKNAAIAAAREELNQVDLFGRKRTELSQQAKDAIVAAEAEAATKTLVLREQLKADLGKVEAERVKDAEEAREKEVKAAEEAAEKQKRLVQELKDSSLATFKSLGAGFEDVVKQLELAQFVEKSKKAIDDLGLAFQNGVISQEAMTRGQQALTEKMDEAVRLGYVPVIEKTKELAAETAKAAAVAEDAGEAWLRSIEGISPALDAIIAKTRAARDAIAGAASPAGASFGGGAGPTTVGPIPGGGGPTGDAVLDSTVLKPGSFGGFFARGGVVPGAPGEPKMIVAHGGETVTPRGEGGRSLVVNLTVNQTGRVVRDEQDWRSLVEELGQDLDARMARMAR